MPLDTLFLRTNPLWVLVLFYGSWCLLFSLSSMGLLLSLFLGSRLRWFGGWVCSWVLLCLLPHLLGQLASLGSTVGWGSLGHPTGVAFVGEVARLHRFVGSSAGGSDGGGVSRPLRVQHPGSFGHGSRWAGEWGSVRRSVSVGCLGVICSLMQCPVYKASVSNNIMMISVDGFIGFGLDSVC